MSSHKTITVSRNEPYIVSGSLSLRLETIGANAAASQNEAPACRRLHALGQPVRVRIFGGSHDTEQS